MSPFVVEDVRKKIIELGFGEADAVGDLCFIVYTEMMKRWNESPRWTTIHFLKKDFVTNAGANKFLFNLAKDLLDANKYPTKFDEADVITASSLAFDVFFYRHAQPYEDQKCLENGDI
jgi:hypothetical protein